VGDAPTDAGGLQFDGSSWFDCFKIPLAGFPASGHTNPLL
jgi:hypothetical protein